MEGGGQFQVERRDIRMTTPALPLLPLRGATPGGLGSTGAGMGGAVLTQIRTPTADF